MLDLVFENLTTDKSIEEKFFEKVLGVAVEELEFRKTVEISLSLVGESRIKELNKKSIFCFSYVHL